jgi:uncharacterized spore protein YtfJ
MTMEKFAAMVERIAGVADKANVNAVFGEPKEVQGRVLIPVAEVSYGFGMGWGSGSAECTCEWDDEACFCSEDEAPAEACCCGEEEAATETCCCDEEEGAGSGGEGGGGGCGARVRPLAYIEVGPEGAKVVPIQDEQKIALMGIAMDMWCVGWIGLVLKSLLKK